ncbi:MAG: dihydroneopterin aldolase [Euzebya sp.]
MTTDLIEICGLRVFGYHGVLESEKRDGQIFVLDITLETDLAAAAVSDDLADTIDYGALGELIAAEVAATRFDLIERLAGHVADLVMADRRVLSAEVRVAKPEVALAVQVDHVAVRLRRSR